MALLEKLAGAPDASGVHCKIPPFHFWCSLKEIAAGRVTQNDVATYWDGKMGGDWEASDTSDLSFLVSEYLSAGNDAAKQVWMLNLFGVMGLVELRAPGYTTDAQIKAIIQSF